MNTAHREVSIRPDAEAPVVNAEENGTWSRRRLIRRSALGLAGVSLTALLGGCGWGDDDDDTDTVGPDDESDGLKGAEDPGEAPGIDEESGITDDVVGSPED